MCSLQWDVYACGECDVCVAISNECLNEADQESIQVQEIFEENYIGWNNETASVIKK